MAQAQYLDSALAFADGLPRSPKVGEERCPDGSSASDYPELPPYTSANSFNLPAMCDESLLTPSSSAGSPSMSQGRKLLPRYPAPPLVADIQEHTPPETSKMYHWSTDQFDMSGQSTGANSPMTTQTTMAPTFMQSYLSSDRRTSEQSHFMQQPNDGRRTPIPREPFFGSFGVSDGTAPTPMQQTYDFGVQHMGHGAGMMIRTAQQATMDGQLVRSMGPSIPVLSQPQPSHFRPPRRMSPDGQMSQAPPYEATRSVAGSTGRPMATIQAKRTRKPTKKRPSRAKASSKAPVSLAEENLNCNGLEENTRLKSTATPEQRCVHEARWRYRNLRGRNMWGNIKADVEREMNKPYSIETLQMIFARLRPEHYAWLPKDEEILTRTWLRLERERYARMLEIFHEEGGSRNMWLSASDIEIKVVEDLRLEDKVYVSDIKDASVRRRRRAVRKAGARPSPRDHGADSTAPQVDSSMSGQPFDETTMEDIIDQVHNRRGLTLDSESPDSSMVMDAQNVWEEQAHAAMDNNPSNVSRNSQQFRNVPQLESHNSRRV